MTIKPMTECPNPLNGIYNPTEEQRLAAGYRYAPVLPTLAEGMVRVSAVLVEGDGVTGAWQVVDKAQAEIDAEAYASDFAANGARYVLENQYIILCDALRQALSQQATQQKLGFEELPTMMMMLKAGNVAAYDSLRDALDMVNAALIRYDVRWWDGATYHSQPELQAASIKILELAQ